MLAALSCLLIALACQGTDGIAAPRRMPTTADAVEGPLAMLSLTCTISRRASTVSCAPATPRRAPGVSASVIFGATGTYAQFVPFDLVKDTVMQVWSFDGFLHNLMLESIGTLNGTTVNGSKVFVTDIRATQGVGTVSIINADGHGDFTAPNQPYFAYNQILAPGANSNAKLWKISVPNTVTAVNMDILMSTDIPAELNVTATPPDSQPKWFGDDSSWAGATHKGSLKGVVTLCFKDSATVQDRQLAVAFAGGTILGGEPVDGGDGCYYMKAPNGLAPMDTTIVRLQSLPQVDVAVPTFRASPAYLRPHDGTSWTAWKLSPDSIGSELNWALEAVDAPYAWGCSTGDTATQVSVIDHVFDNAELASNVASGASVLGTFPANTIEHGTMTSAIVAARGNDNIGITGVMWRAGLRLVELGNSNGTFAGFGRLIAHEANAGSKIVNVSYWLDLAGYMGRLPQSRADSDTVFAAFKPMMREIRKARGALPLIIISAGDSTIDAFWSVFPILRDSLAGQTLVVAGSTRQRKHLSTADGFSSGSGDGRLVDLYAPGGQIGTEQLRNGQLVLELGDGTSFSAPLVAGTAGLLLSFDPRLTPTTLRTLLINGATQGNRPITDPSGQTHYLLNAYQSLKLAAQSPGAPLCGNEVWIANGNVFAQRSTGAEMIGTTAGPHAWGANVMHGGHRLQYNDTSGVHTLDYGNPTWVAGPTSAITDSIPGGTYRSLLLHSHDGDTAVSLSWADATTAGGQPVERVFISLTDSYNSPERDTTFDLPAGPQGANMGGDPPCPTCFFPRLAGIWSVSGAYSPRSPRFLVVVNRDTASSVTLHSPSGGCSQSGSGALSVHASVCGGTGQLNATYVFTPEKADIYDVTVSSHAPWFTIVPRSTLPGAWVYWAGLSELDDETVAGIGSENYTTTFNTPSDTPSRVVTSCNIEYRDRMLASMTGGPAPVATNDACPDLQAGNGQLGNGTISPSVAGRGPSVAHPNGAATKHRASSASVSGMLRSPFGSAKRALPQ